MGLVLTLLWLVAPLYDGSTRKDFCCPRLDWGLYRRKTQDLPPVSRCSRSIDPKFHHFSNKFPDFLGITVLQILIIISYIDIDILSYYHIYIHIHIYIYIYILYHTSMPHFQWKPEDFLAAKLRRRWTQRWIAGPSNTAVVRGSAAVAVERMDLSHWKWLCLMVINGD